MQKEIQVYCREQQPLELVSTFFAAGSEGSQRADSNFHRHYKYTLLQAEAFALLLAAQVAKCLSISQLTFLTDCLSLWLHFAASRKITETTNPWTINLGCSIFRGKLMVLLIISLIRFLNQM